MALDFEIECGDAETPKGTGISRGMVRGRTKVIADLKDIGRIAPEDILVCNCTDLE